MGIFNNSDVEKRVLFLESATKMVVENLRDHINVLEKIQTQAVNQSENIQTWLGAMDKKIDSLKTIIDILIVDNRRLNEMAIENEKRFSETLEAFDKEAEKFKKFYEEILEEKSKRN